MVRTGRLRTSDRRTRLLGRGAKQRGEQVPESFTVLFTARDGGVPVGSAAGCGPLPTWEKKPFNAYFGKRMLARA